MTSESDEIDMIMSEMESETKEVQVPIPKPRQFHQEPDVVDAKFSGTYSNLFGRTQKVENDKKAGNIKKAGKMYPSQMTDDLYYDFSNANRGIAIIFNHEKIKGETNRQGTKKDGDDLKAVLKGLKFDVRDYMDLNLNEIIDILYNVSLEDHSNNDCLLVTVMTHGREDGKILAADNDYYVQELWENFIGDNCESLIGKPKLFFIQACRGSMVDPGVLLKPKKFPLHLVSDAVDAPSTEPIFVIPKLADLLVMYSTAEGHYAFRNLGDGSWFIQALCEELKTNPQEDLLRILTGVNRRVAFAKQSNVLKNERLDAAKQMPNIVSMLTKTMYFTPKTMKFKLENA
ncbi:unnamed protein product [Diamesa hyperborea]